MSETTPRKTPRTIARTPIVAQPMKDMAALVKRRRVLPLASTAAAIGLAGCAMSGGSTAETATHEPIQKDSVSVVVRPRQGVGDQQIKDYANSIESALDQIDRERLRTAAGKANQPPATQPAGAAAMASPTEPVILATSASSEKPTAAVSPEPTPAPVAASVAPPVATPKVQTPPAKPAVAAASPKAEGSTKVSEITPMVTPQASTPSAMGSMTAMALPAADPAPAPAPVAPSVAPATEEPSIESAISVVRKRIGAHPTLDSTLALLLLDGGNAKSAEVARALPEADQKVLVDLLTALQGMNSAATPGTTVADRAAPLVEASKKWQTEAGLNLPKMVLATRVDSFGVYSTVEPRFEQGHKHTVIIYCEVANFSAKKTDDNWYQTRLAQQETLITEDGLLVWRPNPEEVEDKSLNQRRDFYLVKKLTIPESLAAGKYTLQMKVVDRNSTKTATISLSMEIVAPK